jgi:Protein of unknown function (DUF3800)
VGSADNRDNPGDYILGLVSRMPARIRERQVLVMLQFYVDDSSEAKPHVFVLQGLVARPDQWGKFIEKWDHALLGWKLPYFKMAEAALWPDAVKKERIPYLRRLVHEHVLVAVDNVLEVKVLRETLKSHPDRRQQNPYFFCLTNLITHVLSLPDFKDEEIQFICDEQAEKKMVRAAWKNFLDTAPPDKKSRIVGEPIFGTEQRYLPIQAADMYAWWSRRRYLESAFGFPKIALPKLPSAIEPGVHTPTLQRYRKVWTKDRLEHYLAHDLEYLRRKKLRDSGG